MDGAISDSEIAELGKRYFQQNLTGGHEFADIKDVQIVPNRANRTIEVKVDAGIVREDLRDMDVVGIRVQRVAPKIEPIQICQSRQRADLADPIAAQTQERQVGQSRQRRDVADAVEELPQQGRRHAASARARVVGRVVVHCAAPLAERRRTRLREHSPSKV